MGSGSNDTLEESPMAGHTIHIHQSVHATPEQVWEVVTDVAARDRILRSVHHSRLVTEGAYGVGTTWEESRTFYGHHGREELHVTECTPYSHTTQVTRLGKDEITMAWNISGHNDGTTRLSLTTTADMHGRNPIAKVAWLTFGVFSFEMTHKMLEHDLDDLVREVARRTGAEEGRHLRGEADGAASAS